MMAVPQQYCLRWNNHRSNLLTVFDQLLQNEAFTDVTLACEGGASVKCHKMVLAACSTYFQCLFTELPCRHPVVVLKDVRFSEMKAILEYMYRGEVNVAQDQLAALLKVAEALKVKGLVEENNTKGASHAHGSPPNGDDLNNTITTSTSATANVSSNVSQTNSNNNSAGNNINSVSGNNNSSSNNNNNASNNNSESSSPPHSTGIHQQSGFPKSPYNMYGKSPVLERQSNRVSLPLWGVPGLPLPTPPPSQALNSCYETAAAAAMFSSDMSPLRRKKLSSLLMSRDTPILRTVLGQGQADSSQQPVPLVCHPDSHGHNPSHVRNHSNGSDNDRGMKMEQSWDDAHSPYTDISMADDDSERSSKMMLPSSSPQSMHCDVKGGVSSGIATYVPTQKPEWKRYKQYTRNDIMSAIEAVRTGMSALQAARKYGVPSRTLYDKVKKLGITTSRPFRRGSNGNGGVVFPYNLTSGGSTIFTGGSMGMKEEDEENSGYCGLEHSFLHHALESNAKVAVGPDRGGSIGLDRGGGEEIDREALASNVVITAPSGPGNALSPSNNVSTPSPNLIKYAHHNSVTPSPPPTPIASIQQQQQSSSSHMDEDDGEDDEVEEDIMQDQVEDLSVARKPDPPPNTSRVIMPPMSQATATLITTGSSDSHQDSRD